MPTYKAPVDDTLFLLDDVLHYSRYDNLPGFSDAPRDVVEAVLNEAAAKLDPSAMANHAYEVVKAYNGFYQSVPVLKEEDEDKRNFRLMLSATVATTTRKAMWCLGIDVPERM